MGERLDRVPEGELRIHTWLDVSLKELAVLVCESNQSARKHGTRFAFAAIYRDGRTGRMTPRDLGGVVIGKDGPHDGRQLRDSRFQIGDFITLTLFPPRHRRDSHDRVGPGPSRSMA